MQFPTGRSVTITRQRRLGFELVRLLLVCGGLWLLLEEARGQFTAVSVPPQVDVAHSAPVHRSVLKKVRFE